MALKIRLRQQGRKNQQVYRVVVTDSRSPRDGKYVEMIGWYNPFAKEMDKMLSLEADRMEHWLSQGAIPSEKVLFLVAKGAPGVMENYRNRLMERRAKEAQKRKKTK